MNHQTTESEKLERAELIQALQDIAIDADSGLYYEQKQTLYKAAALLAEDGKPSDMVLREALKDCCYALQVPHLSCQDGIIPRCKCKKCVVKRADDALAQPTNTTERTDGKAGGEMVAWRDWVEQRLLNWKQRTMNRSGDHLALDDFMDKESLDDLIDYVCSEYEGPANTHPQPAQVAQPLTPDELADKCEAWLEAGGASNIVDAYERGYRECEAANGIGKDQA